MSNVLIQVNGSGAGDGFLVAPDGARTFQVPLALSTNDGSTVVATVAATSNGAGISLPSGPINIGPAATTLMVHAIAQSKSRGDTVINVRVGGVTTSFALTAIRNPQIGFRGRFEARFATDGDYYNNPRGNDGGTVGNAGAPGWTWALEGEPDFVPADSVANPIDKPIGRVVRFNNPVSLRSFVAPVATKVNEISGTTATGTEVFTSGDPVIGATVNLGPNTYLACNQPSNPADPLPTETWDAGFEPMNVFECHIDGLFSGKSAALTDRPQAQGFITPLDAAEKAIPQFTDPISGAAGTFIDQATFETRRLKVLQDAFNMLSPADQTGTTAGRNLSTRIAHITPNAQGRSSTLPSGWDGKEEYSGTVNDSIVITAGPSSVMSYFTSFTAFSFFAKLFTFHNDELCGYVHGSLSANVQARAARAKGLLSQIRWTKMGTAAERKALAPFRSHRNLVRLPPRRWASTCMAFPKCRRSSQPVP